MNDVAISFICLIGILIITGGCTTTAKYPETVTKTPVRTITTIEPVIN